MPAMTYSPHICTAPQTLPVLSNGLMLVSASLNESSTGTTDTGSSNDTAFSTSRTPTSIHALR